VRDLGFPEGTDDNAIIDPEPTKGASTFADPDFARLSGHMYRVPKAVVVANPNLSVIEDG
jgi:hypothetical protein